jgi:hypothetical protein
MCGKMLVSLDNPIMIPLIAQYIRLSNILGVRLHASYLDKRVIVVAECGGISRINKVDRRYCDAHRYH